MSNLLPIIEQMHNAADDRARAQILLSCPDSILLKYAEVFRQACRRCLFDEGRFFIDVRVAALASVRDVDGLIKPGFAAELEAWRRTMVRFVAAPTEWPIDAPQPVDIDSG